MNGPFTLRQAQGERLKHYFQMTSKAEHDSRETSLLRLHPQAFAVGDKLDGALLVCTVQMSRAKPAHHLGAGMSEGVIRAY